MRDEFTTGMSDGLKPLDDEASTPEGDLARDPRYIKLKDVNRIRTEYAPAPGATIGTLSATRQASPQTRSAPRPMSSAVGLQTVNAARERLKDQTPSMSTRKILDHLEGGIAFGDASVQATLASILSRTLEFDSKGGV